VVEMLESIYSGTVDIQGCLIGLVTAMILGMIISLTHKFTTKTTSNFLLTLIVLPVLVQAVIFLINGNLGTAFAVAGAFSLVRFRSMQGNSKEIVSIFWAMTVGLGVGMGYITYSILVTLIVAIIIMISCKLTNKVQDCYERKLKIIIPENLDYEEIFNEVLFKYTKKAELRKVKTTNMGSMYELIYIVSMKNNVKEKAFLDEIRCRNGNLLVMLERRELSEIEL
jgi:hypothetical protein